MNKLLYELGYRYARMPWEMGPREELVGLVDSGRIAPCRTIDLGCGTGCNAIFMAQQGFEVTGVDFAPPAIERARRRANRARVKTQFVVDDLTNLRKVSGTFDFLVDYGTLDDLGPAGRDLYMQNVLSLTHPGSEFFLWCFEWLSRWWERMMPIMPAPFEPGEVERRFGEHFVVERLARTTAPDYSRWPPGSAAFLMVRNGQV